MRVRIVSDYFASSEVYHIAMENGHRHYNAEGFIVHLPSPSDPYYHVLLDIDPLKTTTKTLLVTYLNREDFVDI